MSITPASSYSLHRQDEISHGQVLTSRPVPVPRSGYIYPLRGTVILYIETDENEAFEATQRPLRSPTPVHFLAQRDFAIIADHRQKWDVSTVSIEEILEILLRQKSVIRAEFTSKKYDTIIRYLRGKHSTNELALSLQRDSFLSHGTALTTHGMASSENILYVNREQSPKDRPGGITQGGMRLAFRNKQRRSKYIFNHSAVKYMLLVESTQIVLV